MKIHAAFLLSIGACAAPNPEPQIERSSIAQVSVRVVDANDHPLIAHVVVHRGDGTALSSQVTDTVGRIEPIVPKGGMITAIVERGPRVDRFTITGVEPRDELTVAMPALEEDIGTLWVTLPGAVPEAASYLIDHGCGHAVVRDPAVPVAIPFDESCLGSDRALDVLAIAMSGESRIAYSSARRISMDELNQARVELPDWSSKWQSLEVAVVNPPPEARISAIQVVQIADGLAFDGPVALAQLDRSSTTSFRVAPFGESIRVIGAVVYGRPADGRGISMMIRKAPARGGEVTLDLAKLLPQIFGLILVTTDPERPEVVWRSRRKLSSTDGGVLLMTWGAGSGEVHTWSVLLSPSDAGRFQIPELPQGLSRFRPDSSVMQEVPTLMFIDSDGVAGYRELRSRHANSVFGASLPIADTARATLGGRPVD